MKPFTSGKTAKTRASASAVFAAAGLASDAVIWKFLLDREVGEDPAVLGRIADARSARWWAGRRVMSRSRRQRAPSARARGP